MQQLSKLLLLLIPAFEATISFGQSPSPVGWIFRAAPGTCHTTTISITAHIPPGWHLYSQSIEEGGPTPTRIKFMPGDDYILQGLTIEKGEAATFYDHTYEKKITWYTDIVTFLQRVVVTKPGADIKGSIDYITCNNELCVRGEQAFNLKVN